ncbi:hypothetical protein Pyn_05925 [Prunus yedoensis var. nudiflora]|uniref:Uncharacterized protein n=1 Tax=Prunus yedoensis var. nudiflora TaxID=2094558 RepID=A0A314XM27_PRUYE|nr:hypothetical protein Pyn_05925 [Prunus yedoensis var. nudiflora]
MEAMVAQEERGMEGEAMEARSAEQIATQAIQAKHTKGAPISTPPTIKRANIGVHAKTTTTLPTKWTSNLTQPAIVNIGADVNAAVLTAPPPNRRVSLLTTYPRLAPAPFQPRWSWPVRCYFV